MRVIQVSGPSLAGHSDSILGINPVEPCWWYWEEGEEEINTYRSSYLVSYHPTWLEVVSIGLLYVLAGHGGIVLCAKWGDQLAQFVH